MKVLLFTNDLMPFTELPTSEAAQRCLQLKSGLERSGIEVLVSMPRHLATGEVLDKLPKELARLMWTHESQAQIISRTEPDLVLYSCGWQHVELQAKPSMPLILDLHAERVQVCEQVDSLLNAFSMADGLLISDPALKNYFYGWLVQAGRIPDDRRMIQMVSDEEIDTDKLAEHLRTVKLRKASQPFYGSVHPKADYVRVIGDARRVELKRGDAVSQRFIVPEAHTGCLELRVFDISQEAASSQEILDLELRLGSGKVLRRKQFKLKDLLGKGRLQIRFPASFSSLGGEEAVVSLSIGGSGPGPKLLCVAGVASARFPLISDLSWQSGAREESSSESIALALSFSPGDQSRLYRARQLIRRAVWLVRRGEWKRVAWAIRRRTSMLGSIARGKLVRSG